VSDPSVAYPAGASGDATVVLVVTVNIDGTVRTAVPETENEPFSIAAASEALGWTFTPATRAGKPIAAKVRLAILFRAPPPGPAVSSPAGEAAPAPAPKPKPRPEAVDQVRVRGERAEPSRTATLTRAEVRQIPGSFGDPFRAIEIMPGVTPIVSGLPFFFIRGAPPGNVGYFLDGVRVPVLFHVGVGPSVVHPGLVQRVDLYPGGYPARFGRYAGGVVSGETLPPATEARGEYNVRLFDAGAMLEVPFAKGRGNVLVGGRYSYTAALLSYFSPNTTLDYWDYQARASYDLTENDRIGVFAFGSYDFLGQRTQTETLTVFGTEFHRIDLRYDRRLGSRGTMRTAFTLGLDRSRVQQDRFVRDRLLGARNEITYRLSDTALLRYGTDVQVDTYDVELGQADLGSATAQAASLFPTRTDLAVGIRGDIVFDVTKSFEVTPGVRLDYFSSQGATAIAADPRLAMRQRVTNDIRILTALGVAHQAPAFVVPIPGFQPGGLKGGLQRSLQESMGLEIDLGASTTATVSVFHNGFFDMSDPLGVNTQQTEGCAPGQFPSESVGGDRGSQPTGRASKCGPRFTPGTIGSDRSGGGGEGAESQDTKRTTNALEVRTLGSAYGLELFVKKKLTSKLGGFLSYTLSRSTRSYGNQNFVAAFDRTHVANAAVAYDLGRNWRAGTRVVFYTGVPRAPDPTSSDTPSRLPAFFRVDLRLEKRWMLGKKAWISGVFEWMNATLTKEAVGTTCTLQGCTVTTIGPVTIPSIGVEGGF
jgi:hypothetical protein